MAMTITISDEREKEICKYAQDLEDLVARKRARFDEVYSDDYNAFNAAFDSFHEKGDWIHVFPEAVRWDCYSYIRPFHKGTFTMAYKYGCPVVPCVITYRERKGIFRLTGKKQLPLFTIRILEPVFPDKTLNRKEAIQNMVLRAHAEMVEAAGIVNNPWPAIHED